MQTFWRRTPRVDLRLQELDLLDPAQWDGISDEGQKELLRQAELMVNGSISVTVGHDSRAATVMSVFGAGGIALLAVTASLIAASKPDWLLICAPVVGAIGLLFAAVCSACAIAPVRFLLPGAKPKTMFYGDVKNDAYIRIALIHSADRAIAHNIQTLERSSKWLELALSVAGSSILASIGFIALWATHRGFF
jgi:hypothetical protein